jgi:hypothetical protein
MIKRKVKRVFSRPAGRDGSSLRVADEAIEKQ